MASVLDVPVSLFANARALTPHQNPLLSAVLAHIQHGTYRAAVIAVRQILHSQGEKAYKKAKTTLASMTPACTMHTRDRDVPLADKVDSPSQILHYDLDNLTDHDGLKAKLRTNPHVAFVFTSPRGNGLKIGVAASGITTANYKRAWHRVLRDLKQQCPDGAFVEDAAIQYVNALCFVSYDPDLYTNPEAVPISITAPAPDEDPPLPEPSTNGTVVDAPDYPAVSSALPYIPSENYITWWKVGLSLKRGGQPWARSMWDTWSAQSAKYDPKAQEAKWANFPDDGTIHPFTVLTIAREGGWRPAGRGQSGPNGHVMPSTGISSYLPAEKMPSVTPCKNNNLEVPSFPSFPSYKKPECEWPVLQPEALYGLAGEIVRAIEPHTESDPVALLSQVLAFYGVAIGRQRYTIADGTAHYGNLFLVIAGRTSRARKGTSQGHVGRLMTRADLTWTLERYIKGAGSGEGLIHAVRDERRGKEAVKEKGRIIDYQETILDEGVPDKRALYIAGEFSSVLKVAGREGNTLSDTLRDIWDTGYLRSTTKNHPLTATNAHIGMIGHITIEEVRKLLTSTDMANGFGNRYIWLCAQRSKSLPDGGSLDPATLDPLVSRLRAAITFGQQAGILVRNTDAAAAWNVVYEMLTEDHTGLADTLLARAEAQVLRLSMLYALLDCSESITLDHLNAALALWQYAEESTAYIFGTSLGDTTADILLQALAGAGDAGLSKEAIIASVFQRNVAQGEISRALGLLEDRGYITSERRLSKSGKGRPAVVYRFLSYEGNEGNEGMGRRYLIASNDAAKSTRIPSYDVTKELRRNTTDAETDSGPPPGCDRLDRSIPDDGCPDPAPLPAVGDWCYLVTASGEIQNEAPYRIIRTEAGPDHQDYAFFAEITTGWLVTRCARTDPPGPHRVAEEARTAAAATPETAYEEFEI